MEKARLGALCFYRVLNENMARDNFSNDRRATITDVAREAGTGKTSISRYLNGETGVLSTELRERIEEAIAKLDYRPNQMARGLKRGRNRLVGMLVADLTNPYTVEVLQGVEAVIVNALGVKEETLETLARGGVPVVLVDRSVDGLVTDMVGLDNTEAVRMAIHHLVSQGFDELLFVVQPYAQVSSRRVRESAFRDTIGAPGVSGVSGVSSATIVLDLDNDETLAEIDARIDAAQRRNRRVALFAANAPVALRLALHLKERHGADWQRQVALMSIDDSEWAELAGMTTVRQPTYTIGERAVEFLHQRIEGAVVAPRECLLPGELIVRTSTSTSKTASTSPPTNNGGT